MDKSGSIPSTIKRKYSDVSNDVGYPGKKTRLQVTIPKLKVSEEQLQRLNKLATKLQMASVDKECGVPSNITGVANTSTTEEVADLAPSMAQTARRKETITEKESPVRHSLSDLLSGSSVSSLIETYPDCEETDVERNICEVPTCRSCLYPKSPEACLFRSDEPLPSENGDSPLLWDKDCITIPCSPDVVSETCQQVAEDFGETLWNGNGQEVGLKTANSEQDESDCCEENQQLQSGNIKDSFSDDSKDKPEFLSANHYQSTVEVMNSLLISFSEEKEAKAQLERLVSQLQEKNQELFSECERLKKLVKDFQPNSRVKAETVSRGIQINMDLSLRRGRAVDRATSPVKLRGPSPGVTLLSYSVGCQASPEEVASPKEVASSFCQTDPVVVPGLLPQSTTQNAVATRMQGIVMLSVQGRAPVPVQPHVSNPMLPNPSQVAYNPPISCQPGTGMTAPQIDFNPSPFTQGQRSSDLISKQLYTTSLDTRYPVNIVQTSGSNTVGYQTSNSNAAGYHSRVPNAVHSTSNSTPLQLFGSHQNAYRSSYGNYNYRTATNPSSNVSWYATQQVRLSNLTDQSFTSLNQMLPYTNLRLPTFQSPFPGEPQQSNQAIAENVRLNATFPNNEIMIPNRQVTADRNFVSLNQTLSGNASVNSSPPQNIGTQQHSALRQRAPTHSLQLFRDCPCNVQTSVQQYNNEVRRLVTRQASKECVRLSRRCDQPLSSPHGIPKSSNVRIAPLQHVEVVPSQHRRFEAYEGQTCTRLNKLPATERVPVMSNWTAKDKEQIEPNLSSSTASNSFSTPQGTPVDGILDQRAQSHVQSSNPYGAVQVQRVYSESQSISSNGKQPVSVVNEQNSSVTQLPNASQQSQLVVSRSNHLVSMSEQRSVPYVPTTGSLLPHDAANRLESSQTSTDVTRSDRNLTDGTVESTVLFCQEMVSGSVVRNVSSGETEALGENISSDNKTWKITPNKQKSNPGKTDLHSTAVDAGYRKEDLRSSINLRRSASTQMGTSDQDDGTQKTSKDAFKAPSKTLGGALEETIQRVILLHSGIANSENSSHDGCASADSNMELTHSVSKESSGQKEKEKVESQVVAIEELDNADKEATNSLEADNSFQDLCENLVSPVIPRMTMLRRRRSILHGRSLEDVGDGSSTTNVTGSSYLKGNSYQNSDFGSLREQAGDKEGSNENAIREQEKKKTFRTDPTDEADSHNLENGTLGGISKRGGDNGLDNTSTKDTVEEEQQGTCSAKDHEMYTPMDSESATSEPGSLSSSVSNNKGSEGKTDVTPNDTVEESQGTWITKAKEINTATDSVCVTAAQSEPSVSVSISQEAVRTSATQNERFRLPMVIAKESEPLGRGTAVDFDNPERGEYNPMPQAKGFGEDIDTCAREGNVFKESVDTRSDTGGPSSSPPLKVKTSRNNCMITSLRTDVKPDAERCGLFVVTSKGPHKQDNKAGSNSLVKNGLNEKSASPNSIKNSEETNLLPIPRVALRVENGGGTVELMWDLPSYCKVTDVNSFEVCAIMVTQTAQDNQFGQWVKIGQIKALKLPMACKVRRLLGQTASFNHFIVRAIGNNGQPGPYSSPAALCDVRYVLP